MLNPVREPFCSITNGGITSAARRSSGVSPGADGTAVLPVCASADAATAAPISATANKRRLFRNARPSVVPAVGVGPEPLASAAGKEVGARSDGRLSCILSSAGLGDTAGFVTRGRFNPPVESTAPLSPRTPSSALTVNSLHVLSQPLCLFHNDFHPS